jgi:low temperature requirement protein LtrA
VGISLAAAHVPRDLIHLIALSLTFGIAAGLWWSYFDKAAPFVESVFTHKAGQASGRFARDAYSILHYPIIVGIVFFAVAAEEVVTHPDEALSTTIGLAMALGVGLVLVSIVASVFRSIPWIFLLRVATGALLLLLVSLTSGISAVATAAIIAAVLVIELKWEHVHQWPRAEVPSSESTAG